MAIEAFMYIKGVKQGEISSDASTPKSVGQQATRDKDKDKTGRITVISFSAGMQAPFDPSSGSSTGKVLAQPVTFTKYFDKTSPLLWQALCTNETLSEVKCDFYRPDPDGMAKLQKFFEIKWSRACLVDGRAFVPLTINPANSFFQNMEEWSFTYQHVEWTFLSTGATGTWGVADT